MKPGPIAVERDEARLRRAIAELLEAGLLAAARGKFKERNPQAEELRAPAHRLDAGYYAWSAHLFRVARALARRGESGSGVPGLRLTAAEALGLDLVELARAEFRRAHPECPHCAALLLKPEDTLCWNCWGEIKKEEAA